METTKPNQFTFHLIPPSLPVPPCSGDYTDLRSNSNISKVVRINFAFTNVPVHF